ncbi:TPA: hypothetical protein ACJ51G_001195 [Aeromonas hydrophila subsp. hydrophila]|uniref:hypothetical protein n=1 Tax=Aeromonas TaxID=642 RepID=UPI000FEB6BF9|nr:hypothetical protein [Aeromonas caviae]WVM47848.1 hypothetical protein V0242_24925 [Aeromonas hydrophila]
MISPEKILCRSLAGVLKHKGIDHEHYVLDGQTYPIASLASELIIQSYVYGVSNIKSHMTLGRDAINCTQIATDDGVVITDDISLHSGAEAMALMASVWRDTLLCADFTAENVIDLTGTRDIWAGYLKSQAGSVIEFKKLGYMSFMQEILNSELIPNTIIDVLPTVLNSVSAAMEVADEGVRSKNNNVL